MMAQGLTEALTQLQDFCQKQNIKLVFMGGLAVGAYGLPRATYDVDAIALLDVATAKSILPQLKEQGFTCEDKEPVKVIQDKDKAFLTLFYEPAKVFVDIFLAQTEYEKLVVTRGRQISFAGRPVNIISPEDLVLIKLQAGRERDLDDIREVLKENSAKLDFTYLKQWAHKLNVNIFLQDEIESLGLKIAKEG